MQDATAPPARPGRPRTPNQVVRELLKQLQMRPLGGARVFEWTVDVRGMTGEGFEQTVAILATRGYRAEYTPNDVPGFAHFILRW